MKSKPAAIRTAKRNSQPRKTASRHHGRRTRLDAPAPPMSYARVVKLVGAEEESVFFLQGRQTRQHSKGESLVSPRRRRPSQCRSSLVCLRQLTEDQCVQGRSTVLRLMCVRPPRICPTVYLGHPEPSSPSSQRRS